MPQLIETWTFGKFGDATLTREVDGVQLDSKYFEISPITFVKNSFQLSELDYQNLLAEVEALK